MQIERRKQRIDRKISPPFYFHLHFYRLTHYAFKSLEILSLFILKEKLNRNKNKYRQKAKLTYSRIFPCGHTRIWSLIRSWLYPKSIGWRRLSCRCHRPHPCRSCHMTWYNRKREWWALGGCILCWRDKRYRCMGQALWLERGKEIISLQNVLWTLWMSKRLLLYVMNISKMYFVLYEYLKRYPLYVKNVLNTSVFHELLKNTFGILF